MFDPIGGFLRIRELYITYLETAFRIHDSGTSQERRALLEMPGALCTTPLLEPLPRYKTVKWPLRDLPSLNAEGPLSHFAVETQKAFVRLAAAGLFEDNDAHLYCHQVSMLERGTRSGQPGIVTSGTGSGKTEAFLLPVLAEILNEAKSKRWSAPDGAYLKRHWWQDTSGKPYESYAGIPPTSRPLKGNPEANPFVPHRFGERREAAVRCLVLYPMNALVEDQLARLRKALDSEPARKVLDEEISGNRIFFGRYTSATPVTGFNIHPRIAPIEDAKRRAQQLQKLFEEMVQTERTQRMVDDQAKFLFPSIDGAELLSRWDMQNHPPDILITNVSMLGAMLNREVDGPLFESTKHWLMSNDDAYFFLVLDELHLQRGAAGTEVAYLLRLLLHRLGLSDPAHRHKVRILASSASLPVDGQEGARSRTYLWDTFGNFGTWTREGNHISHADGWATAIVPGLPEAEVPANSLRLEAQPFVDFLRCHEGEEAEPACAADSQNPPLQEGPWRVTARALGVCHEGPLANVVRAAIEESGRRLAAACWSQDDARPRAVPIADLARVLFESNEQGLEAIRGLLLVQGLGDAFPNWFKQSAQASSITSPSFRLHTFFRSFEGIFAPLDQGLSCDVKYRSEGRKIGRLTVDRVTSPGIAETALETRELPLRLLEVLYCECCGENFVGGMRSSRSANEVELLPSEADLDCLPDAATGQRFEDLSWDQYSVFWPTDRDEQPPVAEAGAGKNPESWIRAWIDPATAVVTVPGPTGTIPPYASMGGWLFSRKKGSKDRHKRTNQDRGTNVPYLCPNCQTDYSPRRIESGFRLSPLRHFRTGLAKTTQLLASELFHLLKLHSRSPKLVSFSDSRQGAAKAALDIESRHHEDVRRDVLITELRLAQCSWPSITDADVQIAELRRLRHEADERNDADEDRRLSLEINRVREQKEESVEGSIRLGEILENPQKPSDFLGPSESRQPLKPLIRAFVSLGIHPVHPAGTRKFKAEIDKETRWFEWHTLFEKKDGVFDWRDAAYEQKWRNLARTQLVSEMQKLVTEIIFSRTYFSIEEAGLGYVCLPKKSFGGDVRAFERASVFLRVFGDGYRLLDSPYDRAPDPWKDENAIGGTNRVLRFATGLWGADARRNLRGILEHLADAGHKDGLLATASLRIKLAELGDDFWRCEKCSRAHLHRGAEICTRCFTPLPTAPTGKIREIVGRNFLSKRLARGGSATFRLHCEELTGQTEDGPDRQRKFRDIVFPKFQPSLDAERKKVLDEDGNEILVQEDPFFLREKEEIDLLAVTTTMEVGIDIGPLQAILQANMPPQRFNYQQRVGRAGRRRMAYSFVLTVCQAKSHDLYYFRKPEKITGDVPPPPFLTKAMPNIARRFLRKWWLNTAFAALRASSSSWPADSMRPPDIHGEFMPTATYFSDTWRELLRAALEESKKDAEAFTLLLCEGSQLTFEEVWANTEELLGEIENLDHRHESKQYGLAHSLAEQGSLPMYGMPTRVRDLYLATRSVGASRPLEWVTVDRDLDLAVYEFAPGSVIVKDKREHSCVGFTGPLPGFIYKKSPGSKIKPWAPAFGDSFWLIECTHCRSWFRFEAQPSDPVAECQSCGRHLEAKFSAECREPLGFRTNLRSSLEADSETPVGRYRSIQAEAGTLDFSPCPGSNLQLAIGRQVKTYRLNRGANDTPGTWLGFSAVLGEQRLTRGAKEAVLKDQMISEDVLETQQEPFEFTQYSGAEAQRINRIWLAAPKTTDALYLAPAIVPLGLSLDRVVGPRSLKGLEGSLMIDALGRTAVRAAALSATFVLMNRAALQLDIDPEEFDVIEPRLYRPAGGIAVPVLQFTDHLVNGAGFCVTLGTIEEETGKPQIDSLLSSILNDCDKYPLDQFLDEGHEQSCEQSCYRCLLRYRNQPFHGLLDWRLGLSFLQALEEPEFQCGLDDNFGSPALRSWPALVERDVLRLKRQFGNLQSKQIGPIWAVRFADARKWAIIAHPLWDSQSPRGLLRDAIKALEGDPTVVVDSFNLARRPATIRRAVLG